MWTCRRVVSAGTVGLLGAVALVGGSSPAAGAERAGPTITRGGGEETFFDDFLFDLCGMTADVTVSERWTLKEFADGSQTLQTVRTFTSSDPRIPTEKGAATSFTSPDGSRVVVGTPLHLFDPDGGMLLIDAGRIAFDSSGEPMEVHGPHDFLGTDPADLYCP